MTYGGGLRRRALADALRLRSRAIALLVDQPSRLSLPREACATACMSFRLESVGPSEKEALSPFVPAQNDSDSLHADPSGTSLALPDRLAGDQPDRTLHSSWRAVRALPTATWVPCRAARRHGWDMVGHRDRSLARRSRLPASAATDVRAAGSCPNNSEACLLGDRPPQPRPDVQRPTVAQPRGALSALPHDPRRPRTSSAPVVECFSTARLGRSFHRAVQLAVIARCRTQRERRIRGESRTWAGSTSHFAVHQSGGRFRDGCRRSGAQHDQCLPKPRGHRVPTSAGR